MLDFLKKEKKDKNRNLYMGLVLKENEGEVLLLEAERETRIVHPVDQKKFVYTDSWEHIEADVDQTLFELEKRNGIEIEKTVLFVYSHLVDQTKKTIKNPYKAKIKAMGEELGLAIMGFVEFHEALAIYFQNVEQTPLSAIIIELDGPSVATFIYKAGKVQHVETIAQTTDLIGDLEQVFSTLKGNYLPTRMILYDSTDLEDVSNNIMTHSWDESLFIQIPKVEVVAPENLQTALYSCFSKQIFDEAEVSAIGEEEEEGEGEEEKSGGGEVESVRDENEHPQQEEAAVAAGFVIGHDIAQDENNGTDAQHDEPVITTDDDEPSSTPQPTKKSFTIPSLTMPTIFSNFKISLPSSKWLMPSLFFVGFLVIVGLLIGSLYFFHTAQLTLLYKTPKITKEVLLEKVDTKKDSKTMDVSGTIKTTGKKTIGERAKGQVQMYNLEKSERTIKKGSELKSDSGVFFTLDADVKIASASSSTTSGGDVTITTGKQKGAVTAKDIGENGNIAKDSKLVFDGVSSDSLKAVADGSFSGGSKRDVPTVSRDDLEKLSTQVQDKAKEQSNNASSISQLTTVLLVNEKYSQEAGQEGNDVSLHAKATVKLIMYDETALKSRIARTLANSVESGYSLTKDAIHFAITKADDKNGSIALTVKVQAIPQYILDRQKLLSAIQGKPTTSLGDVVKREFKADDYDITVDSFIPFLRNRVPFFGKNIQTETRSL